MANRFIYDEYNDILKLFKNKEFPIESEQRVFYNLKWGDYNKLYTPAYWKTQYLLQEANPYENIHFRLGEDVFEEIVGCLLGGYGMKAEIGLLAFYRLKKRGLISIHSTFQEILNSLREPFEFKGRLCHYRFYNQKTKYIYNFLQRKDLKDLPINDDLKLRNWLMTIDGIGPKTASWITRNFLNSESVAIIDIHIYRAGILGGWFPKKMDIQKDYFEIENFFLSFCRAINVKPSKMDSLMWRQMKASNKIVLNCINEK
jgi:N-glycosylase/DNA lyase